MIDNALAGLSAWARTRSRSCHSSSRAKSDFEHVGRTDRLIAILIIINAVAPVMLAFVLDGSLAA
jgi:hypothetical protein